MVYAGPGLGVRILCTEDAVIGEAFYSINSTLKDILQYSELPKDSPTASRLQGSLSPQDDITLRTITAQGNIHATVLPIHSVG